MANFLEKIDDFSIAKKVLLLVLVPILIQTSFILVLWYLQGHLNDSRHWTDHSTEVLYRSENALADASGGFNRSLLLVFSPDENLRAESKKLLDDAEMDIDYIIRFVADNPDQERRAEELRRAYNDLRTLIDQIVPLADVVAADRSNDREENVRKLHDLLTATSPLAGRFRTLLSEFIDSELELYRLRASGLEYSLRRLVWLLALGTFGTLVIGLVAYLLLRTGIISRIETLMKNLETMAGVGELAAPLAGRDELATLDRAIHNLSDALRERDLETELFVYSVSHDLRSPLVNLSGFSDEIRLSSAQLAELLSSTADREKVKTEGNRILQKDIGPSLDFISTATERMSNIIAALLQLSRVGRLEYKIERIELEPLIRKIIVTLSGSIQAAKAKVSIGQIPTIFGDARALEQVFLNLLTNSLKYRSLDRPLEIEIGHAVSDDKFCKIFVKDNGLGIPAGSIGKLFLAFQRFHKSSASGDGIGLAVVRRIVSRLKGKIYCESESGNGATFYILLPLHEGEAELTASGATPYPYQAEAHFSKDLIVGE